MEQLLERLEMYGNTSLELIKLNTLHKISDVSSNLISRLALLLPLQIFIIFFNLGIALWLGDMWGKLYYGFFAVTGFYGLVALIIYASRNSIKSRVNQSILSQTLNSTNIPYVFSNAIDIPLRNMLLQNPTEQKLKQVMAQLEAQKLNEFKLLRIEAQIQFDNLKPLNFVRNTIRSFTTSKEIKNDALNAAIGLSTGFLTQKVLVGKTYNPFKKLLGVLVEWVVAENVIKNAEGIKSVAKSLFGAAARKIEKHDQHNR